MKETLKKLAKGEIRMSPPELVLEPAFFAGELEQGKNSTEVLTISVPGDIKAAGAVLCLDPQVRIFDPIFTGCLCRVKIGFLSGRMQSGGCLEGTISILSNGGEYSIGYRYRIKPSPETASPVQVRMTGPGSTHGDNMNIRERLPGDRSQLAALCGQLVAEHRRDRESFEVYRQALEQGLEITRLYESYLEAWPAGCRTGMSRKVLLYFMYGGVIPENGREALFRNVIELPASDKDILEAYEDRIRELAVRRLRDGKINEDLCVIYRHVLCQELPDVKKAGLLTDVLLTCRLEEPSGKAARVTVHMPGWNRDIKGVFSEGSCLLPVYGRDACFSLYDAGGEPVKNVELSCVRIFEKDELLMRCLELNPNHPYALYMRTAELSGKETVSEEEQRFLMDALKSLPVVGELRSCVVEALCRSGRSPAGWIASADDGTLSERALSGLWERLVQERHIREAWLYLRKYKLRDLSSEAIYAMLKGMAEEGTIPEKNGDTEPYCLYLLWKLFLSGCGDPVLLGILTKDYDGSSEDMLKLLERAVQNGAMVQDLPERILAAELYSGERNRIDETFQIYNRIGRGSEQLRRAYFTVRARDSFLENNKAGRGFFSALAAFMQEKEDLGDMPRIWMLALTEYYSRRQVLMQSERRLCQRIMELLTAEGLVFSYVCSLGNKIGMAREWTERAFIEYRGSGNTQPRLFLRVEPDETRFTERRMRQLPEGIFVYSLRLFSGERLCYEIRDGGRGGEPLMTGTSEAPEAVTEGTTRFDLLNMLKAEEQAENMDKLKRDTAAYILKSETRKRLFAPGDLYG